jgi:hypothetical protein
VKLSARAATGLLLIASACSTATIYRHNAPDLEATIVGGSDKYLYVETEDGRVVRIAREKVSEIDHPGNVEAIVGSILLAYGGGLTAWGLAGRENGPMSVALGVSGGILGIPGVILLASGLMNWSRSASAVDAQDPDLPLRSAMPDFSGRPGAVTAVDAATLPLQATLVAPQ